MEKIIGWIGTGVMGNAMCTHLIQKGGAVPFIFNRTKEKAMELLDLGAQWCDTPQAVAENSDIVFTMVGTPADVEEVYLGSEGILNGLKMGGIIIDIDHLRTFFTKRITQIAHEKGISALDAPVSGGDVGARNGTLAIMVGGDRETFDEIIPLFQMIGENIAYMGNAGSGQHTKMVTRLPLHQI